MKQSYKRNYLIAGFFVIAGMIAMIFIAIWMAFGLDNTKRHTYLTVFEEPIDGLNMNAKVEFNGVRVGKVSDIRINHQKPDNVIVQMAIEKGTPITQKTYARLKPQGITGLTYIGLQTPDQMHHEQTTLLKPDNDNPPTIPTKPSLFSNISKEMISLGKQLKSVSKRANDLLSQKNLEHFSQILANTASITQTIRHQKQTISHTIDAAHAFVTNLNQHKQNINHMIKSINQTSDSVYESAQTFQSTTASVQNQTIPDINQSIFPKMMKILNNFNQITTRLNQLIEKLKTNPSIMIRGRQLPQPGPGEKP
jgi:phospholipid/cholesterol/gamma-HCH transport system substrate-binding protein